MQRNYSKMSDSMASLKKIIQKQNAFCQKLINQHQKPSTPLSETKDLKLMRQINLNLINEMEYFNQIHEKTPKKLDQT